MKDKIQVSFNETQYQDNLKELQLNLKKVNHCLDCTERITGNRLLITLPEIEDFIISRTGFSNIGASAELLNLYAEYIYLEAHLPSLDTKNLQFDDNVYSIKESVLNQLKESCTSYLSDEFINDYHLLLKTTELLNKLSSPALVKCLKPDYQGKYSVNIIALQNSKIAC